MLVKLIFTVPDLAVRDDLSYLSCPLGLAASDAPPPPAAGAGAEDEAVEVPAPPAALDDWELELLDPPQAATPSASTELAARSESFDITGLLFRPTVDSGPIHDKPHHRRS
jgi:hypothetical protein